MKKNTIMIMAAALAASVMLTGCAPKVSPLGTMQASRADGTVTLGYKVMGIGADNHQPSFVAGHPKAAQACKVWGYTTAQELDADMVNVQCLKADPYMGCVTAVFSKVYQCVGDQPGAVTKS